MNIKLIISINEKIIPLKFTYKDIIIFLKINCKSLSFKIIFCIYLVFINKISSIFLIIDKALEKKKNN